jgi:phosphatidylglycerol---prolipoprotein diacylglyceryl transferase
MLIYPNIDPVALAIGPLKIHWYGISYLLAFSGAWLLLHYLTKRSENNLQNNLQSNLQSKQSQKFSTRVKTNQIDDLLFYGAVGVIFGGRIGYTLFYNFDNFISNPLILFQIWNGGMSFHGGLLGVLVAMWLYSRKIKVSFFEITDLVAIVTPFGLACGRIGNFINAELWGRASDLPWAMIFPTDPLGIPRHPSMLYEFLLEGVILFTILWFYAYKERPIRAISGMFLIFYGFFRFLVEFVRQPDLHMGNSGFIYSDWLTQGMILSLPMILFGILLVYNSYRKSK